MDFEAEGLLEGLEGDARAAREALLQTLLDDGVPPEELRQAVAEDRLVLLPVERALAREGEYSRRELAERLDLPLDTLRSVQAAFGVPADDDDEKLYTDEDVRVTEGLRTLLDAGVPVERIAELNRVIGRAMQQVAASSRGMIAEALFRPGQTEQDVAKLAATAARELAPQMAPVLAYAYEAHLRELLRSDILSVADLSAGRPPGARDVTVAFADLVDFTRLGEEIPAEELGAVARRLDEIAAERVRAPVTLVKTLGDAVMLVSPDTDRLLGAALELLDAAEEEGASFPQLRVGVARGPALERSGDWYGSPVNTASRVTGVARAGSVLVTEDARDSAEDGWTWSFAGERKLRGVGPKKLFRARRGDDDDD